MAFHLLIFLIFSFIQFSHSLSTISISETSNQTLICALIKPTNQKPFLNCSSFPQGIQIPINPKASLVSATVAGNGFVCALWYPYFSPISVLTCWRFSTNGTNMYYKRIYQGPTINDLVAGNSRICGLLGESYSLECWQWSSRFNPRLDQNLSSISVGEDFLCGLVSKSRKITCMGDNFRVVGFKPSGMYRVVASGFSYACAISMNNSLECWGDMKGKKAQGKFKSIALGENRSCGLRLNGTVVCWGQNNFNLPENLKETKFISIEAKRSIFCGVVSSKFSLYCWGNEIFDSNFMVFKDSVQPSPCQSECPCKPMPGFQRFCEQGFICQPCEEETHLVSPSPESFFPSPQPYEKAKTSFWSKKNIAFLVVGCLGSMSLVSVFVFFIYKFFNFKACQVHDSGPLDQIEILNEQNQAAKTNPPILEKRLSHLISDRAHLEEFTWEVLIEATESFSEAHKIGTGSFGSVYKGKLEDGREVAIKRAEVSTSASYAAIHIAGDNKDNAFVNELESLSRLNHKNLVRLYGFFEDNKERILVYEYMKNGTLHDHLHKLQDSPLISWTERIRVALDSARGIEYLHTYAVPSIIHRDIKSSNILLGENWTAKVSDFGLSLIGPEDEDSHLSLLAAGTFGYIDPEYYSLQQLTTKSDVYSFGVVLLELLSGFKAIHRNENGMPRNVVDFVVPFIVHDEIHRVLDPKFPPPTPFEIESVAFVGYLAVECVALEGRDRPSMTEVVSSLERALAACLARPVLPRSTTDSSM